MARWMVALLVSLALAPAVASANDETRGSAASPNDSNVSNDPDGNANPAGSDADSESPSEADPTEFDPPPRDSLDLPIARRPRVRVTCAEPGTVLAPLLAELAGLGVEVDRDGEATEPASVPSEQLPSFAREALDGWVRVVNPGPTRFVVEVWLVAPSSAADPADPTPTFEHVATIDAEDEAPASVALRSVELLRAALVGARAFRRAPVAQAPTEPASPPAPREPPPTTRESFDPELGTNLGATIGAGLGASPGGGVVPLAELGLSLRLRAPIELALTGGIPLAESRARVDEGRVDVRVAPLDVSLRFAPRFGLVGLTLGAALGVTVTRVVGSTTDEALLGRSRRTTVATLAGIVGASVSLGETLELVALLRVGRLFSALDVRVGERTIRTWAAWMQATLGLRVRLAGGTR